MLAAVVQLFCTTARADDFDPTLPPDPRAKFKVTVAVRPASAGYVSGSGSFEAGYSTWVNTSANSGYTFDHWELNGERYDGVSNTSFNYTVPKQRSEFVAVYIYDPSVPSDPQLRLMPRLYLETASTGACSFNRTSGNKAQKGSSVYVSAYVNQGYEFLGWYQGETFVSSNPSFYYTMSSADDVTLTARFQYNPPIPGDPMSVAEDISNPEEGDVNEDGLVDVSDLNVCRYKTLHAVDAVRNEAMLDLNGDGMVDVSDINLLAYIILHKDNSTLTNKKR